MNNYYSHLFYFMKLVGEPRKNKIYCNRDLHINFLDVCCRNNVGVDHNSGFEAKAREKNSIIRNGY